MLRRDQPSRQAADLAAAERLKCGTAQAFGEAQLSRTLILIGLILIAAGLLWPWIGRLGLGHLPGDIVVERENFSLYVPITTGLLLSVALTLILWLINR